jgi:mannose-6-phosphate isomerase-like protein (cupin superfamily)
MTGGERMRARIVFAAQGLRVPPHLHPLQDETFEVVSGQLTYFLAGEKHVADAGTTVRLPRGVGHRHHCEGSENAIVIQTMTPGLDFDYLLENLFGRGAEGSLKGLRLPLFLVVQVRKLKGAFLHAHLPQWFQRTVAAIVTPIAYLCGYRLVQTRFSGEEW